MLLGAVGCSGGQSSQSELQGRLFSGDLGQDHSRSGKNGGESGYRNSDDFENNPQIDYIDEKDIARACQLTITRAIDLISSDIAVLRQLPEELPCDQTSIRVNDDGSKQITCLWDSMPQDIVASGSLNDYGFTSQEQKIEFFDDFRDQFLCDFFSKIDPTSKMGQTLTVADLQEDAQVLNALISKQPKIFKHLSQEGYPPHQFIARGFSFRID